MIAKTLCCILLLFGGVMHENKIDFKSASQIVVTVQNNETTLVKGDDKFERVLDAFLTITHNAHDMPAFGVSIDSETRNAKQNGIWIEFVFDKTMMHNNMPFDALLIEVKPDYSGFNIVRKHNNKYDGRCFYFNLENNMSKLYETIKTLSLN